ncbi:hypothetical protein BMF35_a0440 [Aurantiacibacter gangjinensis]|nr:hypothetical protein BMF35_a0440 [Aurantiacibacter gangjinensis]
MCSLGALVAAGLVNTTNPLSMPSQLGGIAVSQAVWGLRPSNLLMVLPIGSFLVVLARSFIGMRAFGLFTPMLIALAFLQIGPIYGPLTMIAAVTVGMIVAPSLLKLRMTRVGFLGVLISLVVFVLALLQMVLDTQLQVDAMPVVVTALIVERWWRQWEKDGYFDAARIAANTMVLALAIQFVMVSHFALMLIEVSPLLLPGFCAIAIAILGRYRGLRLTEIPRFMPIWYEGWKQKMRVGETAPEAVDEVLNARAAIDLNAAEDAAMEAAAALADDGKAAELATGLPQPEIAIEDMPGEPAALPVDAGTPQDIEPAIARVSEPETARAATTDSATPSLRPVDWDRVRAELNLPPERPSHAESLEPAAATEDESLSAFFTRRRIADRLIEPGLLGFLDAGRSDPGDQYAQRADREVQSARGDRAGARQGGGQGRAKRAGDRDDGHNLRYLRIWGADAVRSA